MFDIEFSGLSEFQKQINEMEKAAEELEKTEEISFSELFADSFMKENTDFSTLDEMFEAFGYSNFTQEEFDRIPDEEIDLKFSKSTKFNSWQEMLNTAGEIYVSNKLGL